MILNKLDYNPGVIEHECSREEDGFVCEYGWLHFSVRTCPSAHARFMTLGKIDTCDKIVSEEVIMSAGTKMAMTHGRLSDAHAEYLNLWTKRAR
jgi:hypothetical protein